MKGRRADAAALVALLLLSLAMTWPLVLHMGDQVGHDPYDPLYNVYAMSWSLHALSTDPAGLAQANIFHPHTGTLFYADTVLGLALMGAPFRRLTGNPIFAYNVLFIVSFFVSGLGMYVLAKRIAGSRPAAFAAALMFAFFPYRFAHVSHVEILSYGWIPLCFLFIQRFFEAPKWKNALGIGLFLILQVLSCAYYGEYLGFFAGLFFLYLAVRSGQWRKSAFWAKAAGLAALSAAVVGPYFYGYLSVHRRVLFERPLWEIKQFSAELQHFLASPPWSTLWGSLTGKIGNQETQLYPGIVPLVLTGLWFFWAVGQTKGTAETPAKEPRSPQGFRWWGAANTVLFLFGLAVGITGGFAFSFGGISFSARNLRNPVRILLASAILRFFVDKTRRRRWGRFVRSLNPAQRFYAFLVILSWLLAFGPVIRVLGREVVTGPYAFFYRWIPGFTGLRVPGRFIVLVMLGLSVFSACGLAVLIRRLKTKRTRAWTYGFLFLIILADYAAVPLPLAKVETAETVPPIYQAVRDLPRDAVLIELPMPVRDREEYYEAIPTYRSTFHWKKLVNGYSGYAPPAYRIVREAMEKFPDRWTFDLLESLGVGYVLVHTREFRAEQGRAIVERLRKFDPRAELIQSTGGDFLFRVLPWRREHPLPPVGTGERLIGDRTLWKAEASKNRHLVSLAFDGDPRTAWSTGFPQQEDDFFLIDLGRTERFARIELFLQNQPLDYPRNFIVEGSIDGTSWTLLDRAADYFPPISREMVEDFSKYKVLASLVPGEARYVRIKLSAPHEARHWSIAEFVLYGE
jgi:hypothetical protein